MRTLTAALAIAFTVPAAADTAANDAGTPARYALLVGVARYDSADLGALKYAEADVVALASALRDEGYKDDHITVLTNTTGLANAESKPTGDAIRGKLRDLIELKCKKGDSLLIALAGHGVQFHGDPESYFCPADAVLDEKDKSSLIALGEVYKLLEYCKADMKVLLVDACRDRPASRSRTVARLETRTRPITQLPPGGSAAFFSCSAEQRAFEHDGLKHGVFFHHVIEGLRGKADVDNDKSVMLPELELFVKKHTGTFVRKEFNQHQDPDLRNQTRGLAPLAKLDRPRQPWAGALGWQAGDAPVKKLGLDQPGAVRINFIYPGGAAEAAGLRVGDIVHAIGGRPVRSPKQFDEVAETYAAGETVTLGVARDGQTKDIALTFAAMPTEEALAKQLLAAATRADVQTRVGDVYFSGCGGPQDLAAAADWYAKAAAGGDPEGMNSLALCFDHGWGRQKDPAEAVKWYRRAGERGLVAARYNLARCYAAGFGVPKDEAEAIRLMRLAAEQGYADAQCELGVAYADGVGVPVNDAEAVKWYRRAAAQEHVVAYNNLGFMHHEGRGVPKNEAEGVRLYRRAADLGLAAARYNLADAYADGRGVPADDAEAVRWYRRAAYQGYADAQNKLGVMYEDGRGVAKNDAAALRWYRKAAAQEHAWAMHNIGVLHYEGRGAAKNFAEAAAWYRKAADHGLAEAQNRFGLLTEKGEGVPKSVTEALKWYRKAADGGLAVAQYNVGVFYAEGRGVPANRAEALKWFRKAAAQGDEDAKAKVQELSKPLG